MLAAAVAVMVLLAGCTADPEPPSPSSSGPTADPGPGGDLDVEVGLSEVVADPHYPDYGNPSVDVLAYRLDLSWDPEAEELSGTATLTLRALAAIDEIVLDFSHAYRVDGVTVDGARATFAFPPGDLAVAKALPAGGRATVEVRYRGTPEPLALPSTRADLEEGLGLRVTRRGEVWTMQEPYGAMTWYPVNDHPSDEAVYDIRVTVPEGYSGVASGTFLGSSPDSLQALIPWRPAGTTFHWRSTVPVASYVTTLAIGEYTMITDESADGVPLTYWLRTDRDDAFRRVARRSPELLSWLSDRFGPYPFPSGGVVFVDSESAMETQQMVTFGGGRGGGQVDPVGAASTLLHEYAHQWFGNAVTPRDWTGVWLNEGWAMYCEMLWIIDEGLVSRASALELAREIDAGSRPVAGPPGDFDPGHFAESNVYFGPALMLSAIHDEIGDEAFFALGRDWVQQHRHTSVDRAQFTAFVNEHTGRDFTALIDLWLDSRTTPTT
jgi:aminopeptidase N